MSAELTSTGDARPQATHASRGRGRDELVRPTPATTRVVAGVDEAGLGPLLGPLCIAWAAFETPVDAGEDLWQVLQDVVSQDPGRDKQRLIVADSKQVFTRNERGLKRLENTALAFLAQLDPARRPPADARELILGARAPGAVQSALAPTEQELDRHPWYTRLPALPLCSERGSVELKAERLARALARADVDLRAFGVRLVPAGELNASFRETENKAATVWHLLHGILRGLWDRHAAPSMRAVVDRQGGRWHYGPLLGRGFPDASVRLVTEAPGFSEFHLAGAGRAMRIAFAERAEEQSFAVALASCLAKYAREVAMRAFNTYFAEIAPGVAPTAGYRTDGHRWMQAAGPFLRRARIDPELLQRRR